MSIILKGPSAAALTAGILLLSRARSFGLRLDVAIVGDADDIAEVKGPALVWSPVLAGCGVGRVANEGGIVVIPGPASEPLALCLAPDGVGDWFLVDRAGSGQHVATQEFVRLCRDGRPLARQLARELRRALGRLGCAPEPAVLDLLFGAPVAPLVRLNLALRAGRAMSGEAGEPLNRLVRGGTLPDPLPEPCTPEILRAARASGQLDGLLDALTAATRVAVSEWLDGLESLQDYDGLGAALAEVGSHVVSLPPNALLGRLTPAMEGVAGALGGALGATVGAHEANRLLRDTYQFLGGRFTDAGRYPIELRGAPPPPDRVARWRWFCESARVAADTAESLWRRVMDPIQ